MPLSSIIKYAGGSLPVSPEIFIHTARPGFSFRINFARIARNALA